jgi:vacuolar-type H+-ATPase subunit I/STV1
MPKLKIKKTSSASAASAADGTSTAGTTTHGRQVRVKKRQGASATGIVVGLLGWAIALGLVVLVVIKANETRSRIDELSAEQPAKGDAVNAKYQAEIDELFEKKKEATDEINEDVTLQARLLHETRALNDAIVKLEEQKKSIEETHGELKENVQDLQNVTAIVAEDVDALKIEAARQERNLEKIEAYYQRQEKALQTTLEGYIESNDVRKLRQWYKAHLHTVFGPASGVFLAEMLYEDAGADRARPVYENVLREFPGKDNPYHDHCVNRVQQTKDHEPYVSAAVQLMRYAPLGAQ